MNLAKVMDELGDAVATITGLRVWRWPAEKITPPAAIITYPDEITPDETYVRGMDRMTIPVVVVVGRVSDRATRDAVARYCVGTGANSIKAAIDGKAYTAADSVTCGKVTFDQFVMNQITYLSATFEVDVAGSGTAT